MINELEAKNMTKYDITCNLCGLKISSDYKSRPCLSFGCTGWMDKIPTHWPKTEWERKNWDSVQDRRIVDDNEPLSGRC